MRKKTKILFHEIEYWYADHPEMEMTDSDEEHVHYMINEGFSSGQLATTVDDETGEEAYGWWQIKGHETQ